jgi:hypothetical protein
VRAPGRYRVERPGIKALHADYAEGQKKNRTEAPKLQRVIEADTNVVTFLPDAVATYMRAVDDLHTALVNDPTAEAARAGFRTFRRDFFLAILNKRFQYGERTGGYRPRPLLAPFHKERVVLPAGPLPQGATPRKGHPQGWPFFFGPGLVRVRFSTRAPEGSIPPGPNPTCGSFRHLWVFVGVDATRRLSDFKAKKGK